MTASIYCCVIGAGASIFERSVQHVRLTASPSVLSWLSLITIRPEKNREIYRGPSLSHMQSRQQRSTEICRESSEIRYCDGMIISCNAILCPCIPQIEPHV